MGRRKPSESEPFPGYVRAVYLKDSAEGLKDYPFSVPVVRTLTRLEFAPTVTFLVGENGCGKSTLLEAIAVRAGLNAEGGSRQHTFETEATHSALSDHLAMEWNPCGRPRDAWFLRAESFYNVATYIYKAARESGQGIQFRAHEMSHGESFLAALTSEFEGKGLYLLDEPESALSPMRQLTALAVIQRLVTDRSQFVIATHSPILMAYPGARILELSPEGIREVAYEDTEHFNVTHDFLTRREMMLRVLLREEDDE